MLSIDKQNVSDKIIYIVLFLIAFGAAFSSTYNPLNFRRMQLDSSVYITVANGITHGHLPYKDFVDNKGPLAYFLSVPGLLLGGFTGVWITELVILFITALFAWKTTIFFTTRNKALFVTAFGFVALLPFFFINAGTEEYSLPFLMISFYIFTKYYFSPKKDASFHEIVILGICFASAIMIRLNMFPLWAGFCLVIIIEALIKRHFTLLGKYAFGFCLGILIIFIPIYIYLKVNGIIDVFLIQVIFNGTARGFNKGIKDIVKTFYETMSNGYSFLPLILGVYWMIINFKKHIFAFYAGYTFSYFLMILFFSFLSSNPHYNLVLIPYFFPAISFLVDIIYSVFYKRYGKNLSLLFLSVLFCLFFSEGLSKYIWNLTKAFNSYSTGIKLINAGKIIDENTKQGDKIISLGHNAFIYPFTQRESVSKYFYQGYWLRTIPSAREDFLTDVLTGKPFIIAIFNDEDGIGEIDGYWHEPVLTMIDSEYRLLSDDNGFKLFIRNN